VTARREPGQGSDSGHNRSAVDQQLCLSFVHGQHDLLALLIGRELCNLNPQGANGPDIALAPESNCSVGPVDQALEGRFQTGDRLGLASLRNRPLGANVHTLGAGDTAFGRGDDVPLTGAGKARDAGLDPPKRSRIGEGIVSQPS
jgi:hypothetical protein